MFLVSALLRVRSINLSTFLLNSAYLRTKKKLEMPYNLREDSLLRGKLALDFKTALKSLILESLLHLQEAIMS